VVAGRAQGPNFNESTFQANRKNCALPEPAGCLDHRRGRVSIWGKKIEATKPSLLGKRDIHART